AAREPEGQSLTSGSPVDRLAPEENVLRPLQIIRVELPDELLPRGRGDVPLVLLDVADLDPLDVVPARLLGAGDGPLDPIGRVTDDAGQRPRDAVVVLTHPLLVGGGVDALLERRDHVPHLHPDLLPQPAATGSKQSSRSPSCRTRCSSQATPFTATSQVSRSAPMDARSAAMLVSGATSIVTRFRPSGMKRRRLPCMWTVTLMSVPALMPAPSRSCGRRSRSC